MEGGRRRESYKNQNPYLYFPSLPLPSPECNERPPTPVENHRHAKPLFNNGNGTPVRLEWQKY